MHMRSNTAILVLSFFGCAIICKRDLTRCITHDFHDAIEFISSAAVYSTGETQCCCSPVLLGKRSCCGGDLAGCFVEGGGCAYGAFAFWVLWEITFVEKVKGTLDL